MLKTTLAAFTGFLGALFVTLALSASLLPPAVNGPWLGDQNSNLYSIITAHIQGSGYGAGTAITTIDQTVGQANCTQTGLANMMHYLKTSAATGYICLPPALQGRLVMYQNATGQTIDIYGSNTFAVSGTQDKINGTAGSTAYTSLTNGLNTICFAPFNGLWSCITGS